MPQYTMLRRAQTLQRDRHAKAVACSRFTGALHRNTAKHPSGGPSGAARGSRAPGGAIRTGIIAAAIIFHQETSDVRPDLMVDAEGTRRYLRPCGFTEVQIDEIIADALADEASAGVVTQARTSARNVREHVVTPLIIPTPKDLFKISPKLSKEIGNTYGEGETDESVPAGDQAPAEEEEAPRWVPRMGADGKRELMPKGEQEEVESEAAAEAAAPLVSTTPCARNSASFTAMDELWEQARLELEDMLATSLVKGPADSGAFYSPSNVPPRFAMRRWGASVLPSALLRAQSLALRMITH